MKAVFTKSKTILSLAKGYALLCQISHKMLLLSFDFNKEGQHNIFSILKNLSKMIIANADIVYNMITENTKDLINNIEIVGDFSFKRGLTPMEDLQFLGEECKNGAVSLFAAYSLIAKEEEYDDISKKSTYISNILYYAYEVIDDLYDKIKSKSLFKSKTIFLWQCQNCGYIEKSKKAPNKCPNCLFPKNFFSLPSPNIEK